MLKDVFQIHFQQVQYQQRMDESQIMADETSHQRQNDKR